MRYGTDEPVTAAPTFTWTYEDRLGQTIRIHEAHLCGLSPDTAYRYVVESGPSQSDTMTFRTAPDFEAQPDAEVVFAVLGDARTHPEVLGSILTMLDSIAAPDYILFTGDWVFRADDQDSWDDVFERLGGILQRVPVLTTVGNHESDDVEFFSQFALPGDEQFFSLDIGPVHIAVVDDSNRQFPDANGDGRAFLVEDLQRPRNEPWTFVLHHQPMYSTPGADSHGSTERLQEEWADVISENGVQLVFSGHDHKYERTVPIRGVTYVVTGGAGAILYESNRSEITAAHGALYHGLIVRVRASSIDGVAYGVDRTVLDSFMFTAETSQSRSR